MGLVEFNNETKRDRALDYIEDLHARGGTAIEEALETSIRHLNDSGRCHQGTYVPRSMRDSR